MTKVREVLSTLMLIARLPLVRVLLALGLAGILVFPARAAEKEGMPCLSQEEETCLPTSTANLIVWFGHHGYPKLIVPGDSDDDGYIHTVHAMITAVHATYQFGTDTIAITYGIQKYIREAGYSADVEYRGLDWSQLEDKDIVQDPDMVAYKKDYHTPAPFTQDWLQTNDDPNKCFILLLVYCKYNPDNAVFSDPVAGHAVTLVSAEPDTLLIHDPANLPSYPGRKLLTPRLLTGGSFNATGFHASTDGLLILDAPMDEMWRPNDGVILLTGAVCITMHPNNSDPSLVKGTAGSPNGTIGGSGSSSTTATSTASKSTSAPSTSWTAWLFSLLFSK